MNRSFFPWDFFRNSFSKWTKNAFEASKNLRFFDASNPFFVDLEKEFRKKSQGKNEGFFEILPKMGFSKKKTELFFQKF